MSSGHELNEFVMVHMLIKSWRRKKKHSYSAAKKKSLHTLLWMTSNSAAVETKWTPRRRRRRANNLINKIIMRLSNKNKIWICRLGLSEMKSLHPRSTGMSPPDVVERALFAFCSGLDVSTKGFQAASSHREGTMHEGIWGWANTH